MTRSRSFGWIALATCFAWVLAGGCSSSNPSGLDGTNQSPGGTAGVGGRGGGPTVLEPDASANGGYDNGALNPLCGEGACIPDNANSCRNYRPPAGEGDGGQGQGGADGGGGDGGQSQGGAAGYPGAEGGAANHAGAAGAAAGAAGASAGAGGDGGDGGDGGATAMEPSEPASYGCQVVQPGTEPARACALAGTGKVNAPCFSASDCAAGLACVTEGDAGRCLPYCCGADTDCGASTYCAARELRQAPSDTSTSKPRLVPVCVPTDDCSLEDEYPCPAGSECRCKGNTACMVVEDGTTTCLEPGDGQQGDACPCAWNHVCSSVTQTCVKLCRTDPAKNDCGEQKCQASSELPPNFGVCVGPVK